MLKKEGKNKMKNKKLSRALKVGAVSSLMLGGIVGTAAIVDTMDYKEVKDFKAEQTKLANVDNTDAGIVTLDLADTQTTSTGDYQIKSVDNLVFAMSSIGKKYLTYSKIPAFSILTQSSSIRDLCGTYDAPSLLYEYITWANRKNSLGLGEMILGTGDIDAGNISDSQREAIGLNKDLTGEMIYLAGGDNDCLCLLVADDKANNCSYGYIYFEGDGNLVSAFKYSYSTTYKAYCIDYFDELLVGISFTNALGNNATSSIEDYPQWTADGALSSYNVNPLKEVLTTLFTPSSSQTKLCFNGVKMNDRDYPTISAGDIVVNVDNPLTLDQIKSCFKANDPTEGDLTDKIQFSDITYKLDTNGKIAVGEYSITASVSDTSGNSASVTKKIHVVDITSPIVAGTNFSTGNITKLTDAEILKHLTYSDNYYSKDNISITLSYDDYKNNYTKPGDYEVRVTATDSSGNVGTTTLTITVTDTTKPVITATNKTTGNSTCLSQADLLALFNATDDVTSSPTITIVTDNYTANYRKPGSYTIIAKATDEAGNSSQATATITVTDTTAPTISAINATKNQSYTAKLTEAELKALFKVSDDVTATDKIVVTIVTDNYTAKYNTPGSYTVTAKATDEAGNTAQATVTIKVIDDIKPVIVLTKEIKTTTQLALTMADIAKYVKATDTIDGNITPQITDKNGYLTKTNKVGTYNFEVTATDKAGNVAKETFVIIVEDKDVPVITVSGYTITAAAGQVYKRSDIIKFLIQTGQLTEEEADTVSVESNYFDSENPEAGNYELTITRADGSVQQMSLLVTESNNDVEKNEGFWGWIKNHLAIVLTALGAVVLAALGFVFLRKKRR